MLTDSRFYLCIAVSYILMQLLPRQRRCLGFAVLNLIALNVLFKTKVLVTLALFACGLWALLAIQQWFKRRGHSALARVMLSLIYVCVGALFVFHKSFLDAYGMLLPLQQALQNFPHSEKFAHILAMLTFSYVFLRAWDAIRSVSEGQRLLGPISFSGYLFPFFMAGAGPINVYAQHIAMDSKEAEPPRFENFLRGIEIIVAGLFFKVVIAELYRGFFIGVNQPWPLGSIWQTMVAFIYVFFDFYGYSLVAVGVGALLGVPTPVNFDKPWRSVSVTEFWTRWHMSLGNFVRTNIFNPLQLFLVRRLGGKRAYYTGLFALIVSFGFVGLWHSFTWRFLMWGVSLSLIMIVEKLTRDKLISKWRKKYLWILRVQRIIGPVYVFIVVVGTLHFVMKQLMGAS